MPSSGDLRDLARYVINCSALSLDNLYLARLNHASHLELDVRDLLRRWVEAAAVVELVAFMRQYGEELIAADSRALARAPRSIEQSPAPPRDEQAPPRDTLRDWWPNHEHEAVKPSELQLLQGIVKNLRPALYPNSKDPKDPDRYGWTEPIKYGEKSKRKGLTAGKLSAAQEERQANSLFERKIIDKRGGRSHDGQQFRIRTEAQHEWRAEKAPKLVADKPAKPRFRPKIKRGDDGYTIELDGRQLCTRERPKAVHAVLADGDNRFDLEEGSTISVEMQDGSVIDGSEETRHTAKMRTEEKPEPASHTADLRHEESQVAGPHTAKMRTEEPSAHTANLRYEGAPGPSAHTAEMRYEAPASFRRVPILDYKGAPVSDPDFGALVVYVAEGKRLFESVREDKDVLKRSAVAIFNHFHGKGQGWIPKWEPLPPQPKPAPMPTAQKGGAVHDTRRGRRASGGVVAPPDKYAGLGR